MPLIIQYGDLTKIQADAIVNAANSSLLGGGGVDGAIHRAAGPELLAECRALGGAKTGEVKVTQGYRLPARYVIHAVGPVWQGGGFKERELLVSCYRKALEAAKKIGLETIAFPLISAGAYGYPKDQALEVALETIGVFLMNEELTVYLIVFEKETYQLSRARSEALSAFIDAQLDLPIKDQLLMAETSQDYLLQESCLEARPVLGKKRELEALVQQVEETFSAMILRLIDEKGFTDAQTYKRANLDRKHFSKIRSDVYYRPSKSTVLALCIALELNLDQTTDLLQRAGFAFSNCSIFDIIIRYHIELGGFNIFQINQALFAYDQPLLGLVS